MTTSLVIGWPVDPVVRAQWELRLGKGPLPYYAGSVEAACFNCGIKIFLGPRSQEALRTGTDIQPACGFCAAASGSLAVLVNLGNPNDLSGRE